MIRSAKCCSGSETTSQPKGCRFVPGGRIRKGELIEEAFARIVATETACRADFESARFLGVYQHMYSTSRFGEPEVGTHYVVLDYELSLNPRPIVMLDSQHSICVAMLAVPAMSIAQNIGCSITIAPPELPVYEQPSIPAPGYLWPPGYWAYGPYGYYWVPGTWVEPPSVGLLWTPGYWGWRNGVYVWNAGYWGPHIGFYGGVNYGFGYGGVGYEGGYWNNGVFSYNRAVNNFGGVTITNVYSKTVINNVTRLSFNGGTGGTTAQPTPQEQAAAREQHVVATTAQIQHEQTAITNKALLASENHGRPAIAATSKPGEFTGKGVVAAREPGPTLPGTTAPGGAGALEKQEPSGKLSTAPAEPARTRPATTAPAGVGALEKQEPAGKLSTVPAGADRKGVVEPAPTRPATAAPAGAGALEKQEPAGKLSTVPAGRTARVSWSRLQRRGRPRLHLPVLVRSRNRNRPASPPPSRRRRTARQSTPPRKTPKHMAEPHPSP